MGSEQDLDALEIGGLLSWTLPAEVTYVTEYRQLVLLVSKRQYWHVLAYLAYVKST